MAFLPTEHGSALTPISTGRNLLCSSPFAEGRGKKKPTPNPKLLGSFRGALLAPCSSSLRSGAEGRGGRSDPRCRSGDRQRSARRGESIARS